MASSTTVRLLGFVAQTKKPIIRRCLRPRSRSGRHSCRPARAPVPAALHRRAPHGPSATAPPRQLSVDTRRPCTCNQGPSTRSHRTVDNSLITARRRYSTFLSRVVIRQPIELAVSCSSCVWFSIGSGISSNLGLLVGTVCLNDKIKRCLVLIAELQGQGHPSPKQLIDVYFCFNNVIHKH